MAAARPGGQGKVQCDARTATSLRRAQAQPALLTVHGGQPLAHLFEPEAAAVFRGLSRCRIEPDTGVAHLDDQLAGLLARAHGDLATFDLGLEPVADAVLDQRL
ncbi:hypothetical protein D9M68_783460 [compost metagenome]